MPADALDLLTWPSLAALLIIGSAFGATVVWQARSISFTTFLAIAYAVVFFTFLTALRAFTGTEHWGRTISTAIQCVAFAIGIGLGLKLRKRAAR